MNSENNEVETVVKFSSVIA